ncbi:vitamin K epoxide reductase complex subunit 1-like protein 1 isoform X2 [Procambarus clarkii]|nr:vitamin K epoxide reductase complex subunit 1-like protein 1 [Procambarus clarkii]XP_045609262.1 vitamin K epoxide reductase complex subunit 1-like protein 1 [Procambarus clarkii]
MVDHKGRQAVVGNYRKIRLAMMLLAFIGIGLSLYALYVEVMKESDAAYQAMCDISPSISCSKVFTSKYGRGFGIIGELLGDDHIMNQPNSIPGIIFYSLIIVLGETKSLKVAKVQRTVISLSNLMSAYLAYLLYFVLKDFCVVCVSTYIVNILLTTLAFMRVSALQRLSKIKTK